ncbi:putative methyltransferase-domain-containing protein [Hysterangium stoloniferum]|nr:putative methyltransferase-domain-containing protein [Hysterangium stoloniferum]
MASDLDSHPSPSWFPFNIPDTSWLVEDADEEVFVLYSQLQSADSRTATMTGLGSVDSTQGALSVTFDLGRVPSPESAPSPSSPPSDTRLSKRRKSSSVSKNMLRQKINNDTLEITLFQDITGLRSRKGDTGESIIVELARVLLSPADNVTTLLPTSALSNLHILELGSGTGLLSVVLAPYVAKYTATDLPGLVPLIRKNQTHNISASLLSKVFATDIDWFELHNTCIHRRNKFFKLDGDAVVDLILAVDCIYNPSLIAPLLSTIHHFAVSPTLVLVVLELRSSDVTREFIAGWLSLAGKWEVWSIPLLGPKLVIWVGRRTEDIST